MGIRPSGGGYGPGRPPLAVVKTWTQNVAAIVPQPEAVNLALQTAIIKRHGRQPSRTQNSECQKRRRGAAAETWPVVRIKLQSRMSPLSASRLLILAAANPQFRNRRYRRGSVATMVKFAALRNGWCRKCGEMLHEHWSRQQKAAKSRIRDSYTVRSEGWLSLIAG